MPYFDRWISNGPYAASFDLGEDDDQLYPGNELKLELPEHFMWLVTERHRFKVVHGGRGSGKSWAFAKALLIIAMQQRHLILCAREYQNSIEDSVYRLLVEQIVDMKLQPFFTITKTNITCRLTGTEFIFKGLHHSIAEIKSLEGATICWVEEAQSTAKDSWRTLVPTIRNAAEGWPFAEIWVSFNPYLRTDPTCQMFIEKPDPDKDFMKVMQANWDRNVYFPPTMERDRIAMQQLDPDAYEHVYNGAYITLSEATIFRGNYEIRTFEEPEKIDRLFYGLDYGFSTTPSFATRSYIEDDTLYITHEAVGLNIELDDHPAFLAGGPSIKVPGRVYPGIPGIRDWPIKADAARPESTSYLKRKGFNVVSAKKWQGSVEDGITHLKGFKKIVIHERCPRMAEQARLYSFKTDPKTNEVLPIIVKKHDDGWDSLRYALDGYIQARGRSGVWAKLASPHIVTGVAAMRR